MLHGLLRSFSRNKFFWVLIVLAVVAPKLFWFLLSASVFLTLLPVALLVLFGLWAYYKNKSRLASTKKTTASQSRTTSTESGSVIDCPDYEVIKDD